MLKEKHAVKSIYLLLKLFALTQYCTKLFQVTLEQITILSKK